MFFPGGSIAIGEETGSQDDGTSNLNTTLGTSAGVSLISGEHNVNIGAGAGANNFEGSDNTNLGFNTGLFSQASNNTFVGAFAGMENSNGAGNTFIGKDAGRFNTTAANNLFAGLDAGRTNTTGGNNVFLGKDAGRMNSVGTYNVFIGIGAGLNNTVTGNTFVGAGSGESNTTGAQNTFLGYGAGSTNNTTSFNTMIGSSSGANNELGEKNTFLGALTGQDNQGNFNTFLGAFSGESNNTGNENTFVGEFSGQLNSTGSNNTFLGRKAGSLNTTASGNTFVGRNAGMNNVTGASNTFIGQNSGTANTASNNTFIGQNAGNANTSAIENTFVGQDAGRVNTTGGRNTFIGAKSGAANSLGTFNVFVGDSAGVVNSSGSSNTFIGGRSGRANTIGSNNTFLGEIAGRLNTTASFNTFMGYVAGGFNTTGESNTFIGSHAGIVNSTGSKNTFIGQQSGNANTTGTKNVFIGEDAGLINNTGSFNVIIGQHTGATNSTGSHNTFVGFDARPATGTLTNATAIGDSALVSTSNAVVLGNNARIGIGTSNPDPSAKTEIKSNTQGFLMPRMSTAERNAIVNPAAGLMVFDLNKTALYFFDGGAWLPMTYTPEISLPPTTRYPNESQERDYFGYSVAVDGNYAIIGAPNHNGPGPGAAEGAAFVFKQTNGLWTQEAILLASDAAQSDVFGWSVDISGDYAIVGAPGDDESRGSAYIFFRTGNTWSQQAKLTGLGGGAPNDRYGLSVSTIGTKAVVGAPEDDVEFLDMGRVYIYERSGTTWPLDQLIDTWANTSDVWFGYSVSMVQDYIAVGAPHDGGLENGRIHIYFFNGSNWIEQYTKAGDNADDNYGFSVSLDSNLLAIGVPQMGAGDGYVSLRSRTGSAWDNNVNLSGLATPGGNLGFSVAITDDYLVVGDPETQISYILTSPYPGLGYEFLREIKDPNPNAPNTQFGFAVAVDGFDIITSSPGSPCGFCPHYPGKVFFLNLE
jgi:FG-GAP repeat protein